jgi:Pentapeptide repeats (8 copies)
LAGCRWFRRSPQAPHGGQSHPMRHGLNFFRGVTAGINASSDLDRRVRREEAEIRPAITRTACLIGADLRDADLTGANLIGANLPQWRHDDAIQIPSRPRRRRPRWGQRGVKSARNGFLHCAFHAWRPLIEEHLSPPATKVGGGNCRDSFLLARQRLRKTPL